MIYATVLAALALPSTLTSTSQFEAWKKEHNKVYETVEKEAAALETFIANKAFIEAENAKNLTYKLGLNEFSDLTWEQFKARVGGEIYTNKPPKNMNRVHITGAGTVADSVDWVAQGAVTPIKNQGHCGSCWSFSTTGAVEGAFQIAGNPLTSLSEEDLVQCDKTDNGCQGGLMDQAFEWIEKNGVATEASYPYTSGTGIRGTCDSAKEGAAVVTISSYRDVPHADETALKSAVAQGPVSIAIEADQPVFQHYSSGVLDSSTCGTRLDHGVLAVGYGTDSATSTDYWKVKNSWGTTWGENGYIRMVRGKNMCGIASQASYPKGATKFTPGPTPPSPPPPPAGSSHYEDPKAGCRSDEVEITLQGVTGDMCSPKCGVLTACPTDKPTGVTAAPQCALQDSSSGQKYCALICSPTSFIADQKAADAQCGTNASCKSVQMGVGVCTYDD